MPDKCPNKNECGSCEWSEIPYKGQLKRKLFGINEAFSSAKIPFEVKDIKPSPKTSHYRNRMDFVIDFQGNFGLRQKGKWWKVIDNHPCFISDERIEKAFHICFEWVKTCDLSYWDRRTYKGLLSYIVLRVTLERELMVNVVTSSDYTPQEESFIREKLQELAVLTEASTLVWSINTSKSDVSHGDRIEVISGSGFITENISDYKYRITPNSFFQTNSLGAGVLLSEVLKVTKKISPHKILDLYCGSGFFTIPLSGISKDIIGVELVEEAIEIAKTNAEINNSAAKFVCSKTEDFDWLNYSPDLFLVDPPRSGLHPRALEKILTTKAKNIIYVSCNFSKFAQECEQFLQTYVIEKSVAVDMFPHTPHVELITLLTRK